MFIAVPQDQFISAYNRELSRTDLHGHMNWYEVLTGRCRLYFDIDKITFERFFDILSWMRHNFPRETWRIFIRESDTQSFHIIGSTVYENPMHVGYAVAQKNPPGGIDMAVYTVNRCWKLPYSRRRTDGSFRRLPRRGPQNLRRGPRRGVSGAHGGATSLASYGLVHFVYVFQTEGRGGATSLATCVLVRGEPRAFTSKTRAKRPRSPYLRAREAPR